MCRPEKRNAGTVLSLPGEITVFMAVAGVLVLMLILSVSEAARIQTGRWYLRQCADSAIDSEFSMYHRKLWENYRLLGLEHYSDRQIEEEIRGFLEPYFRARNRYPLSAAKVTLADKKLLTGEDGKNFEKEVLDYMKYGIAAEVMGLPDIGSFREELEQAGAVNAVSGEYSGCTREAVKLEKQASSIRALLNRQSDLIGQAAEAAECLDAPEFIDAHERLIRIYRQIPQETGRYEKTAEELSGKLENSRAELEKRFQDGQLKPDIYEIMLSDLDQYDSYVSAEGERRREISELASDAAACAVRSEALIEEAAEIGEYLDSFDSDDEDYPDPEELWEPVAEEMSEYPALTMFSPAGVRDEEKETALEKAAALVSGEILNLVLPEGSDVSEEKLGIADMPGTHGSGTDRRSSPADSVYMGEYYIRMLSYYGRESYDRAGRRGSGGLEAEYVLYGKNSDRENLACFAEEFAALRTGLNLISIYRSSEKRNRARELAMLIGGAAGLTPFTGIIQFFVISSWAAGQALYDTAEILDGGKVPLMHTDESFSLDLDGLLSLSGGVRPAGKRAGNGWDYQTWLRILLILRQGSKEDYRAMDMIQMAMCKEQKDFCPENMICGMKAEISAETRHVFAQAGGAGGTAASYLMEVSTAYEY